MGGALHEGAGGGIGLGADCAGAGSGSGGLALGINPDKLTNVTLMERGENDTAHIFHTDGL